MIVAGLALGVCRLFGMDMGDVIERGLPQHESSLLGVLESERKRSGD